MTSAAQRQVLGEGRFLRLVSDQGWEFVERTNASGVVAIAAVNAWGHLLLIEQYRPPVGCNVIELPAGLAGDSAGSESEQMATAARRELLEETGYDAQSMKFLMHGPNSAGLTGEVSHLFLAEGVRKVHGGGGVEGEKIIVHEVSLQTVDSWLAEAAASGKLIDPKIYAALYFLRRGTPLPAPKSDRAHVV